MGRPSKSQWDFGELFPPQQVRRVFTVSDLTSAVRKLIEQHLGLVWVSGEVSGLRLQASGHMYFTLKDATAQLNCVLFRGEMTQSRPALQDGGQVVLQGDLTVYEPRGQYQLIVRRVELQGVGALQVAFERLKQKLAAEGLFDPGRKRPLPRYPRRIGVVTSPTGAAIKDVLHVVKRRHPGLELIVVPCRVQGEGAAAEVAAAIRLLNEFNRGTCLPGEPKAHAPKEVAQRLALILVTRGGGSLEDLWAFNEEVVARAIFESDLPVVSAIGHEIDFTISDFVADLRAATPSAAAEIITDGFYASREFIAEAAQRLRRRLRQELAGRVEDCRQWTQRLARMHPRRHVQAEQQRIDDLGGALLRLAHQACREQRTAWSNLAGRLAQQKPSLQLAQHHRAVDDLERCLRDAAQRRLENQQHAIEQLHARVRLLSPEGVLRRGYSITMDAASGRIIRDAAEVRPGQKLKSRLERGELRSTAEG